MNIASRFCLALLVGCIVCVVSSAPSSARQPFQQQPLDDQPLDPPLDELPPQLVESDQQASDAVGAVSDQPLPLNNQNELNGRVIDNPQTPMPLDRSLENQQNPLQRQANEIDRLPATAREQQMIDEVLALRRQMGGGISEQLKDLNLGDGEFSPEQLARDELSRLAREESRLRPGKLTGSTNRPSGTLTMEPTDTDQIRPSVDRALQQPGSQFMAGSMDRNPTIDPNAARSSIRAAARQLEEAAAELENAQQYNEADKIRRIAGELWLRAR